MKTKEANQTTLSGKKLTGYEVKKKGLHYYNCVSLQSVRPRIS